MLQGPLVYRTEGQIRTDFDLEEVLIETNELQDRMLEEEEGRVLVDFREASPCFDGDSDCEDSDVVLEDEPAKHRRLPATPTAAAPTPHPHAPPVASNQAEGPRPSHQSRRRKRHRENNPQPQLRSDRLEAGRIKKARREAVDTGAELSTMKPGLKLPDGCEKKVYTLAELKLKGFTVQPWDGR